LGEFGLTYIEEFQPSFDDLGHFAMYLDIYTVKIIIVRSVLFYKIGRTLSLVGFILLNISIIWFFIFDSC